MSEDSMTIITRDPLALPAQERLTAAMELLKTLRPDATGSELHESEAPAIFLAIENFEAVHCPLCKADLMDWWMDAMDQWAEGDQNDLAVETPCCHGTTSLNDLDYDMPQGFSRVGLELQNVAPLSESELQQIEEVLGVPVRVVLCHT